MNTERRLRARNLVGAASVPAIAIRYRDENGLARVAGGAVVGIEDAGTIGAYGVAIDQRYTLLENAMRDYFEEKWGKGLFVENGKVQIEGTPYFYYFAKFDPSRTVAADKLAEFKSDSNFYDTWEADLRAWRTYWVDLRDSKPVPLLTAPFIKDDLDRYDTVQREWQKKADARGIKTAAAPLPPKTDIGGNPLSTFGNVKDLVGNITFVVGLGFVFYIFTMFIAPPLLSGAARTKEGYRAVRG